MNHVPEMIYEKCPSCHPQSYENSVAKYAGEKEFTGEFMEYLYVCVKCGARIWVDESWAFSHSVKGTE